MHTIAIMNRDLGFFTEKPITAQRFEVVDEDGTRELVWCNHAGAEVEEVENDIIRPEGIDSVYISRYLQCDKCEAYKPEGTDHWHEAPNEGIN